MIGFLFMHHHQRLPISFFRPIFGVSLDLACASHSQPAIFTSTCTRLHIPNNYTESENLAQLHFQIKPSCTATLTSHTDITHAMSAQDVRLFAFVSYDKKLEKSCNSLQQQERKIDIFIGEVNLANMDLLKKAGIGCINDDSECEGLLILLSIIVKNVFVCNNRYIR